ncbi:MAG: Smr/MutS family protein [Gammaproteobacteria bacterium]|nr:Smr/MutS family protein [Gammaproteobacteria bacterium]MBU1646109.1 Smr/MutS family protein [Gammaproteobacteria bacterium]MBU1972171.1 Smr/MutS family protein [Gammaproteobacteria bacterium]
MKRREVPEEARQIFRAAVADATPLAQDRAHHEPPLPPAIPRSRQQDEAAALSESINALQLLDLQLEGGDEAAWARSGIARSVLRDLRRGRWVVEAQLDLHGLNRDEARHQVALFVADCVARERRCVRIVHGKGLRSPGREPVLKKLVLGWLAQKKEVLAFCQARTVEGGAGAAIVLLASR